MNVETIATCGVVPDFFQIVGGILHINVFPFLICRPSFIFRTSQVCPRRRSSSVTSLSELPIRTWEAGSCQSGNGAVSRGGFRPLQGLDRVFRSRGSPPNSRPSGSSGFKRKLAAQVGMVHRPHGLQGKRRASGNRTGFQLVAESGQRFANQPFNLAQPAAPSTTTSSAPPAGNLLIHLCRRKYSGD